MSKYVVLTDSTCDLPEEAAKQHNIDIVCFKIALDGEGYTERVDFTPEQFCEMLKKASGLPTTAQITQFEFFDKFEEYDRQGVEQTLYISINAGGSGTNAAAHAAAEQFHEEHPDSRMEIFIVDSHAYSMAEGAGVIEAKQKLDAGETMESVVEYLNDKYAKMEILLTAYTLKVIRKSGRISAAAAIAGDLLGIHPIFTLNDGVSQVVKKVRGDKGGCQRHGDDDGQPHGAGHAVLHRRVGSQIRRRICGSLHEESRLCPGWHFPPGLRGAFQHRCGSGRPCL